MTLEALPIGGAFCIYKQSVFVKLPQNAVMKFFDFFSCVGVIGCFQSLGQTLNFHFKRQHIFSPRKAVIILIHTNNPFMFICRYLWIINTRNEKEAGAGK